MQCFFPAQATGEALYNTITMATEDASPAGRLPYTWYDTLNQVTIIILLSELYQHHRVLPDNLSSGLWKYLYIYLRVFPFFPSFILITENDKADCSSHCLRRLMLNIPSISLKPY